MKSIFVLIDARPLAGCASGQEIVHENGNVARDMQIASLQSFLLAQSELAPLVKSKVWDSTGPDELRVAFKKFFQFLDQQKGIQNEKVLAALT